MLSLAQQPTTPDYSPEEEHVHFTFRLIIIIILTCMCLCCWQENGEDEEYGTPSCAPLTWVEMGKELVKPPINKSIGSLLLTPVSSICFYLSLQFMTFILSLTIAVCLLFPFSPRNINLGNLQPRIVSSLSAAASSSSSALVVFQSSSLGFWQKCHRCTELPKPFHANYYAPNYLFFASPFRAQITISCLCCWCTTSEWRW